MAFADTTWYCHAGDQSTTGHYAVAKRSQNAAVSAGALCRQFTAPAVNTERVFVCIVAGTTANVADATWTTTRGAKTTDGTVTWQECTGASAMNGDVTNTPNWTLQKATGSPSLGSIIKRNNNASYQICTTAGSLGASEPAFSDTAGVTTTETSATAVWTSLGPVGNFPGGGAPHARLANACTSTWFAAGNTVYVGDTHAESQTSSITISPAGSISVISKFLCHRASGSYPPTASDLTTGASIATTAAVGLNLTTTGLAYVYGLAFKVAVGVSSGSSNLTVSTTSGSGVTNFENCSFWVVNTSASSAYIQVGNTGVTSGTTVWTNCTLKFGVNLCRLTTGDGSFFWQNTGPVLVSGSAIPNSFIGIGDASTMYTPVIVLEALDLSQINGSLFTFINNNPQANVLVKDCKLNASLTVATPPNAGMSVQLARSDSAATSYRSSRLTYAGTETTETVITRVGGAVDPSGQAQARKIVSTANAQWLLPFQAETYAVWNAITGANVTVTVRGTVNAGALPNNDDIWLEVEYLGSSASPLGSLVTTTKANLFATNAAVASDSSSWNGGGSGAGWLPFKLVTTLSAPQPGLAGSLEARVRVGKASTTYYLDPLVTLS